MTKRIVAAGQNFFRAAIFDLFKCVADGVGAGSAGVGNNGHRPAKIKRVAQIQRLPLRLIMDDTRGLFFENAGRTDGLAKVFLAERHFAARGAEHDRQVFFQLPAAPCPRLVRGEQQHF